MHRATGLATLWVAKRVHGVQVGMVTWLLALLAIELALPHHAVWKVCFHQLHPHLSILACLTEQSVH